MDNSMDRQIYQMQVFRSFFLAWRKGVERGAVVEGTSLQGDLVPARKLMDGVGESCILYAEKGFVPYPDVLEHVVRSFSETAMQVMSDLHRLEATVSHAGASWPLLMDSTERRCAETYLIPEFYPASPQQLPQPKGHTKG